MVGMAAGSGVMAMERSRNVVFVGDVFCDEEASIDTLNGLRANAVEELAGELKRL